MSGDLSHAETFSYDGHGNITSKTGMGSYTYASGTHRVGTGKLTQPPR
ncbi:hypothetical protein [uncultured Umboniibacter sp.]|nr:hypothetical protein [uncultured Umboniibacter sp.]